MRVKRVQTGETEHKQEGGGQDFRAFVIPCCSVDKIYVRYISGKTCAQSTVENIISRSGQSAKRKRD